MPFLSPAKLLIILVIALVVLGPDKLPKMAKQIGNLWGDFRKFREKLESEVRGNLPDLPSTDTIAHAMRSPFSFLDSLADSHGGENGTTPGPGVADPPPPLHGDALAPSSGTNRATGTVEAREEPAVPGVLAADLRGVAHEVRSNGGVVQEDPGMN